MSSAMGAVTGIMGVLYVIFAILFMKAKVEKDDESKTRKKKKGCCGGIHTRKDRKKRKDGGREVSKKPKKKQTTEEKIQATRNEDAAGRWIGDQVMIGQVQGDSNSGGGDSAHREDTQVIIDRIKILYGWLQIFTSLTFTFDIPWPIQLRTFSLGLNFINLDFGNILGGTACTFQLPFLEKMVVQSVFPFMLLVTILLARVPAWCLRKQNRQKQKALQIKLISSLALILYPGLCTRLFSSLKVVTVEGLYSEGVHSGKVLAVDYAVEAFGPHHMNYVYLAIVCMVVFVVGIPLCVLLALKNNKKWLYFSAKASEEHQRHHEDIVDEFGTLYLQ